MTPADYDLAARLTRSSRELAEVRIERNHHIARAVMWKARAYRWMAVGFAALVALMLVSAHAYAKTEDDWNRAWCAEMGGRAEVRQVDRTRVDCLTDTHAIEADFAGKALKPYEALGQAIHYSRMTGKLPGILLIVVQPSDCRYVQRARLDAGVTGVWVSGWTLQPVRVWTVGESCDE